MNTQLDDTAGDSSTRSSDFEVAKRHAEYYFDDIVFLVGVFP